MKKQRYKKTNTLNVGTMVQGMIGENRVANLLLANGYIVSRPDVDLGVDMVVCKPKKWGKRTIIKNWISIQVKYHSRISPTTFGHSLAVRVTPNHCDYIATPTDDGSVIFFKQETNMKGKWYQRDFAYLDKNKFKDRGNFQNQNKRRWAKDYLELPR